MPAAAARGTVPAVSLVQVLTTFDSRDDALRLAHAAVAARVAACVQLVGPITSVYRWQGSVEEAAEFLCVFKAPAEALGSLLAFVRERHPYHTPELTVVESLFTDQRYLAWASDEVGSGQTGG